MVNEDLPVGNWKESANFPPILMTIALVFVLPTRKWELRKWYSTPPEQRCSRSWALSGLSLRCSSAVSFAMAQWVKKPPAMQETQEMWIWSLGWEDPLEEEMATNSSILAWKIPWTEEPCKLLCMGSNMPEWMSTYCMLICCASSAPPETVPPLIENIKFKLRTWRECSVTSVVSDSWDPTDSGSQAKKFLFILNEL